MLPIENNEVKKTVRMIHYIDKFRFMQIKERQYICIKGLFKSDVKNFNNMVEIKCGLEACRNQNSFYVDETDIPFGEKYEVECPNCGVI